MEVKNSNKNLQTQVRRLEDKKQKIIKNHEKEMNQLKNLYHNEKEKVSLQYDEDLYNQRVEVDTNLAKFANEQEQKLEKVRDELFTQGRLLEEKRYNLKKTNQKKIKDIMAVQGNREKRSIEKAKDNAKSIERKTNEILEEAKIAQDVSINEFKTNAQLQKIKLQGNQDLAMKAAQNNFKTVKQAELIKQKRALSELVGKHERDLSQLDQVQKNFLDNQTVSYNKRLAMEKATFENMIKEQKESYNNKYKSLIEQNKLLLSRVKGAFDQELKSLSREHSALKKTISSRGQDPFYNSKTLNPKIVDKGKFYEVSLEVPSWEQEFVQINSDKRNVDLTLTRSFHSIVESETGDINTSKKSEVFAKTFNVPDIVDSNNLTRRYHEGVLTFKLMKA